MTRRAAPLHRGARAASSATAATAANPPSCHERRSAPRAENGVPATVAATRALHRDREAAD